MKTKKLASLILALVMALALAVPAFAASTAPSLTIGGGINLPTVDVDVPTTATGNVLLNPYKLVYEVKAAAGGNPAVTSTDQVITPVQYLTNKSDVAIQVGYTVKGEAATGVTLATAPIDESKKALTTKSVFLYVELGAADKDDGTADPTWATSYDKTKATVVSAKETKGVNTVTLAASPDGTNAATTGGYAAIKVAGNTSAAPTEPWATGDKVDVTLTFTFTPTGLTAA